MKLQFCIYFMVLATVARSMNLPGDLLAMNEEETFVAVNGDASMDSQSKSEDVSVNDSDMSDMGHLQLELDLVNAENVAELAAVAQEVVQEVAQEPENEDVLNAEQTVEEETTTQEQEPENENQLDEEMNLQNVEQAVEEETSTQEQESENEEHLNEEETSVVMATNDVVETVSEDSQNENELDLLNEEQTVAETTTTNTDAMDSEVAEESDADQTNESPLNEEKGWWKEPEVTCAVEGLTAVDNDCHKYTNCSDHNGSGKLTSLVMQCDEDEAFHSSWNGCRRDLNKCSDNEVNCTMDGSLPDPNGSTTSYYLCQKSLADTTFHLFHVHCKTGEVFLPALGKCFIDMTDFSNAYQSYDWVSVSDLEVVKKELEEYRIAEKMELKLKKEEAKMLKKLQKELEKMAKKKAKEEAKAQKEAALLA